MHANDVQAALALMSCVPFALKKESKYRQNNAAQNRSHSDNRLSNSFIRVLAIRTGDKDRFGTESGVKGLEGGARVGDVIGNVCGLQKDRT